MSQNRYSSNASALGSDLVGKLGSSCIEIKGNNSVAQSAIYCLIGLGVGEIRHVIDGETRDVLHPGILKTLSNSIFPECSSLSEALTYIAPQLKYSQMLEPGNSTFRLNSKLFNVRVPESKNYDCVGDLIAGTLLADEFRKNIGLVSAYEQKLSLGECLDVNLAMLLHKFCSRLSASKLSRVLVIGAGGLGTYCTYILSQRAVNEILLCEPDFVEESNLNRQLLYTGRVGDLKAEVLSERLSNERCKIIPRVEFFDENFNLRGKIDAIFCCTDTLESRVHASNFALENKIPLVEGACTPTMGSVTTYFPGLTRTISEQRDLLELLRLQKSMTDEKLRDEVTVETSSCARISNPSVISPNVIIGSLQAIAIDAKYDCSGALIESYPQIYLNLLRNAKFSHGVL